MNIASISSDAGIQRAAAVTQSSQALLVVDKVLDQQAKEGEQAVKLIEQAGSARSLKAPATHDHTGRVVNTFA